MAVSAKRAGKIPSERRGLPVGSAQSALVGAATICGGRDGAVAAAGRQRHPDAESGWQNHSAGRSVQVLAELAKHSADLALGHGDDLHGRNEALAVPWFQP